ncbi:MAG: RDD family protein [Candidatus Levybacteria bacterium]|nr:RDD family protein [Candidatus Levybacteria bacterium]
MVYATALERTLAAILDGLLIVLVYIAVFIVIGGSALGLRNNGITVLLIIIAYVLALAFYLWDWVILPAKYGYTIGGKLMKIKIVDENTGKPIRYARMLGRYVMSVYSLYALGLGYFRILWHPKKQSFHDTVVCSVVLKDESLKNAPILPGFLRRNKN